MVFGAEGAIRPSSNGSEFSSTLPSRIDIPPSVTNSAGVREEKEGVGALPANLLA